MKTWQIDLPLRVRAILLAGVFCVVAGGGLVSYQFYTQPKTLTIAVGAGDGETRQLVSVVASRLATRSSQIRLK